MQSSGPIAVRALTDELADLESRAEAAESRVAAAAVQIRQAATVLGKLMSDIQRASDMRASAASDIAKLQHQLSILTAKARSARQIVAWLTEECAALEAQRDKLEEDRAALRADIRDLRGDATTLP